MRTRHLQEGLKGPPGSGLAQAPALSLALFGEDGAEDKYHDTTDNKDEVNKRVTSGECAPGKFFGEKEWVKFVGMLGLSGKQQRTILRYSHLLAGMLNVFFIYTPLGDVWAFQLLVRIILVPVIIITGFWMWQQAKVRKLVTKGLRQGGDKEIRIPNET